MIEKDYSLPEKKQVEELIIGQGCPCPSLAKMGYKTTGCVSRF